MFQNNVAWGIVSGRYLGNGNCNGPSGGVGIFGAKDRALSHMGVSLLLGQAPNRVPVARYSQSSTVAMSCTFYNSSYEPGRQHRRVVLELR